MIVKDNRGCKQGWSCTVCRVWSAKWKSLAPEICKGSAAEKWALKSVEAASNGGRAGAGHRRMLSGNVLWCRRCGCYGDAWAKGLAEACKGKPLDTSGGGRAGQLNCLRAGRHPRTRKMLPLAVDEDGKFLDPCREPTAVDALGAERPTLKPYHSDGKSSSAKMGERLERVRTMERSKRITRRRMRGKQQPGSEWLDGARLDDVVAVPPAAPSADGGGSIGLTGDGPRPVQVPARPKCLELTCFVFGCQGDHSR